MSKRRFAEACSDFLDASITNLAGAKSGAARAPIAVSSDEQKDRVAATAGVPLWQPPSRQQLRHMGLNDQVDAITANLSSFTLDGRQTRGKYFGTAPAEQAYVKSIQQRLIKQMGKLGQDSSPPRPGAVAGLGIASASFRPPPIVANRLRFGNGPKPFVHSPLAAGEASPFGLPDFSPKAQSALGEGRHAEAGSVALGEAPLLATSASVVDFLPVYAQGAPGAPVGQASGASL